nr:hypothetical protein GCM10020093_025900 [Planobispora longispora]
MNGPVPPGAARTMRRPHDEPGEPVPAENVLLNARLALAEQTASDSRRMLLEVSEQAAAERNVSAALRDAIIPGAGAHVDLPHARVMARYVPAGAGAGLGGDWYDAGSLPDGRAVLAIGDVAGHGLPALARMAQLRHALAGLAMSGAPPGRLLSWLDDLVVHRMPETTATAIVGHLDPDTSVFTWGQAGHPAPILVRDGTATRLAPPQGCCSGSARACRTNRPRCACGRATCCCCSPTVWWSGAAATSTRGRAGSGGGGPAARGGGLDAGLNQMIEAVCGSAPEDDVCLLSVEILG